MERIALGDRIKFTENIEGIYWQHGYDESKRIVLQIAAGDTAVYLGNSAIKMLSGQSTGQRMLLEINAPVIKL